MELSGFSESNAVLGPPPGMTEASVQSASVFRGRVDIEGAKDVPCVVTCWKVTAEELAEIQRTGRVWLTILGATMPPALVAGVNPFEQGGYRG